MDISFDEKTNEETYRGPLYDAAMRGLVGADPAVACRILGVPSDGPPEVLPASFAFPASTLTADLLLRVTPGGLAHVEYVRRVTPDLVSRMLGYRWVIMRGYPRERLSQHVIVLGEGRIRGHDDLASRGFQLDLNVVYLREVEPAQLLQDPSLATLAALGRGTPDQRAESYRQAVQFIWQKGGDRSSELVEFATLLGSITLDTLVMRRILEEVGMSNAAFLADVFRDSGFGSDLVQEGRKQGREQGREEMLAAFIADRFGARPEIAQIAHRLANWPESSAVHAVIAAKSLDQLAGAEPPD